MNSSHCHSHFSLLFFIVEVEEGAVVRASLDVVDTVSGLGLTIETLEYHLPNSSDNIQNIVALAIAVVTKNLSM